MMEELIKDKFCFQRGRFYEVRREYQEAKGHFQNAISLNPAHIPSLQHLVRGLYLCVL